LPSLPILTPKRKKGKEKKVLPTPRQREKKEAPAKGRGKCSRTSPADEKGEGEKSWPFFIFSHGEKENEKDHPSSLSTPVLHQKEGKGERRRYSAYVFLPLTAKKEGKRKMTNKVKKKERHSFRLRCGQEGGKGNVRPTRPGKEKEEGSWEQSASRKGKRMEPFNRTLG